MVFLSTSCLATQARGAEPWLQMERASGAELCPDEQTLRGMVRAVREGAEPPGDIELAVRVWHDTGTYVAELRATGRRRGTRRLVEEADDCEGLAMAIAVTAALILDGGLLEEAAPVAPPLVPEPAAEPAQPSLEAAAEPALAAPADPPRDEVDGEAAPASENSWEIGLEAGPLVALGLTSGARPGVLVGAWLGAGSYVQVAVHGLLLPSHRTQSPMPGVEVALALHAARLSGCGMWRDMLGPVSGKACLEVAAGRLEGRATGFEGARGAGVTWTALGTGVGLEGPIAWRFSWRVHGSVVVAAPPRTFSIGGLGVVVEPATVGSALTAGLGARLW